MLNTFTVKARRFSEDTVVYKNVTSIFSNLGGFLLSTKDGNVQLPAETEIIIDGSDDRIR